MTAIALFDIYFYKYLRTAAVYCGCNFFDNNFRIRYPTVLFSGNILFGGVCLAFTLATKDFETALNALFGWGLVLQV